MLYENVAQETVASCHESCQKRTVARPKKQEIFRLKQFKNSSGTTSWRIVGTKPDGTRVRKNFADKIEALQELADLEALLQGGVTNAPKAQRTLLTPEEISDAEVAIRAAGGRGVAKLISHYLSLESRARTKGVTLDAALSFVESHYRNETKAVTILNAYNEFVASREDGSPATKTYYESTLKLLLKPDPNKWVHAFTVSDIERALANYKNPNSKRTIRGAMATFFRWAVRHHHCMENPCDRLDKLQRDMSQIAALSLDECKRLLYAAILMEDKATAACVAIGLFVGLRPSEINDLKTEDILKDKIRVSGGKLRRKLKRSTPIPLVLAAWLEEFPFTGLPAGWSSKLKRLKKATKAKKWVQDIIRHTSITFQTERDKDEARTAFNNGTSIQMMNRHYRDIIDDEKTIVEFWSLTPAKLRANPPLVELEIKRRVNWPDKKALAKLVWQKPLIHAAQDIGVSDVALKKHCVKLGIELPRQGHWLRQ